MKSLGTFTKAIEFYITLKQVRQIRSLAALRKKQRESFVNAQEMATLALDGDEPEMELYDVGMFGKLGIDYNDDRVQKPKETKRKAI